MVDRDDRLLYVNHPQPGAEDYAGAPVYEFVDAEYHEVLRAAVDRARAFGVPQRFESYAAGPDGASVHYSNWVMAVHSLDVEGLVAFVATDVTRAGRIEAQLELSESALRSLVENSPDTILIADRDRRILFVNRLRYGLQRESVMGEPVESFIPEEHRAKVSSASKRCCRPVR